MGALVAGEQTAEYQKAFIESWCLPVAGDKEEELSLNKVQTNKKAQQLCQSKEQGAERAQSLFIAHTAKAEVLDKDSCEVGTRCRASLRQVRWAWQLLCTYPFRSPGTGCFVVAKNKRCSVCLAVLVFVNHRANTRVRSSPPGSQYKNDCRPRRRGGVEGCGEMQRCALPWWWYQPLGGDAPWQQQQQSAGLCRSFCLASLWSCNPALVVLLCKQSFSPPKRLSVCPGPPLLSSRKGKAVWEPPGGYVSC